jgi:hypothetical protein
MQEHTKRLLGRAERIAEIRAKLALKLHNNGIPSLSTVPTVARVPHASPQSTARDFTRAARPDPAAIEKAINDMNHMTIHNSGGASKTASIKTPFNPVAESKKKVLNKHGLRLTLDNRRPTIG